MLVVNFRKRTKIHKWNYSPFLPEHTLQTRYMVRQQSSPVGSGFSWSQKAWQQKSSKRTSQKLSAFDAISSAIRGKNPSNFKRWSKAWAGNHSKPLHRLRYYIKGWKILPLLGKKPENLLSNTGALIMRQKSPKQHQLHLLKYPCISPYW